MQYCVELNVGIALLLSLHQKNY